MPAQSRHSPFRCAMNAWSTSKLSLVSSGALESTTQQSFLQIILHRIAADPDFQQGAVEFRSRNRTERLSVHADLGAAAGQIVQRDDVARLHLIHRIEYLLHLLHL